MNKYVLISSIILMSGCSSTLNKCDPIVVEVPVVVKPTPPVEVTRPSLPIQSIDENSDNSTVVKAYAASIKMLQGYSKYLEELLDGYRK